MPTTRTRSPRLETGERIFIAHGRLVDVITAPGDPASSAAGRAGPRQSWREVLLEGTLEGYLTGRWRIVLQQRARRKGPVDAFSVGTVWTEDGPELSLFSEGLLTQRADGTARVWQTVHLSTPDGAPPAWVSGLPIRADGILDAGSATFTANAYLL